MTFWGVLEWVSFFCCCHVGHSFVLCWSGSLVPDVEVASIGGRMGAAFLVAVCQ